MATAYDLRFFECPISCITRSTWSTLRLVNECLDGEGNLIQMPFAGPLTEQPRWFRQASQIVRSERAAHRQRDLDRMKKEQERKKKHGR